MLLVPVLQGFDTNALTSSRLLPLPASPFFNLVTPMDTARPKSRLIFWCLFHRADMPWHKTAEVRAHLRDGWSFAGKRPEWHHEAGPIWNPYSEEMWYFAAEDIPWAAMNITRRRGHNQPCDNDNGCAREIRPKPPSPPVQGTPDPIRATRQLLAMKREREAFMSKFIGDAD